MAAVALLLIAGLISCKSSSQSSRPGTAATAPDKESKAGDPQPTANQPPLQLKLSPLASQEVQPSNSPQTVVCKDQIKVVVPGGLLKGPAVVSIARAEGSPPPPFECYQPLASIDVSLGDLHELGKEIEVEVPFNESVLPADRPRDVPLDAFFSAAYFDTKEQQWVELPVSVRPDGKTLVARTRHLSLMEYWYLGTKYTLLPCGTFGIFYDLETVNKKMAGYAPTNLSSDPKIPGFINDIRAFAKNALDVYASHGLKPYVSPAWILVTGDGNSEYNRLTRRLYITFGTNRPDELQYNVSHELFHAVQSCNYSAVAYGMDAHRWWLEATADYSGGRLVWHYGLMGKQTEAPPSPKHLTVPVNYFGTPFWNRKDDMRRIHQYMEAFLLEYLCREVANAKPKDSATSRPDAAHAFVAMYRQAAESDDSALTSIDKFLIGRLGTGRGLDYYFPRYAAFYLLDSSSPLYAKYKANDVQPKCLEGATPLDGEQQEPAKLSFDLEGPYCAKAWALPVKLAAGKTSQAIDVEVPGGSLPDRAAILVYNLPRGNRTAKVLAGSVEKKTDTAKVLTFTVHQDDIIIVVAANNCDSEQIVKANVGPHVPGQQTIRDQYVPAMNTNANSKLTGTISWEVTGWDMWCDYHDYDFFVQPQYQCEKGKAGRISVKADIALSEKGRTPMKVNQADGGWNVITDLPPRLAAAGERTSTGQPVIEVKGDFPHKIDPGGAFAADFTFGKKDDVVVIHIAVWIDEKWETYDKAGKLVNTELRRATVATPVWDVSAIARYTYK